MTEIDIPAEASAAGWNELISARYSNAELPQAYARALHAAAPLIVAAAFAAKANEFESNARACKNLGTSEFSKGRADGLTVAKTVLEVHAARLRGEQS